MKVDLSPFKLNSDLIVHIVPQLNCLLLDFEVSIVLLQHRFVSALLEILVPMLVILEVDVDLGEVIS